MSWKCWLGIFIFGVFITLAFLQIIPTIYFLAVGFAAIIISTIVSMIFSAKVTNWRAQK